MSGSQVLGTGIFHQTSVTDRPHTIFLLLGLGLGGALLRTIKTWWVGKGREFLGSIINSFLFLNSSLICVYETAHSLQKINCGREKE